MTSPTLAPGQVLPDDGFSGALAGRVWDPSHTGPSVVAVRERGVIDLSRSFPTSADLFDTSDPAGALRAADGPVLGSLEEILGNTSPDARDLRAPWFLSPVDVQAVKAAGVTFATSMIERVIEERARGDAGDAATLRERIVAELGGELRSLVPGSREAVRLKDYLVHNGLWSQYLEVGIGPDAEVFSKAQPLSSIGVLADVGVLAASRWNNPEPEVVLAVDSRGRTVGASLGNDVNLRDVEGRSALLLGKAKDNNASAAIGPFVRVFDDGFGLDDVRRAQVTLRVEGDDGFELEDTSSMTEISRDPLHLVAQMMGDHHQYPDGAVLFLGTMFAPVADRDAPGEGFTHHSGDVVTISSPRLGALVNRVRTSEACEPWVHGIRSLFRNLTERGLLG